MPYLQTPNEVLARAKNLMLQGRDPVSKADWLLIVNCWAFNFPADMALLECKLLCAIFNAPIDEEDIAEIVMFQTNQQNREN